MTKDNLEVRAEAAHSLFAWLVLRARLAITALVVAMAAIGVTLGLLANSQSEANSNAVHAYQQAEQMTKVVQTDNSIIAGLKRALDRDASLLEGVFVTLIHDEERICHAESRCVLPRYPSR